MNEQKKKLAQLIEAGIDSLDIVITKEEILKQDISAPLALLSALLDNECFALYFREKVNLSFKGFDDQGKNLWEIPEVRKYVCKLDSEFPYWFYFLSKSGNGLYVIYQCYMIPFLSDEDDFDFNIPQLQENFINKWVPALSEACEFTDMSDEESHKMCMGVYSYIINRGNA
ncbi:chlororespiratory reduction 6 domain-containing protein [uncultured Bacteroides sp.]|uniref:chlororespiratory reduction 6 domain-containing protein n=1 Tax=uncultured Bacteroides sp. TaxID=162156 RepID=UPI002AA6A777|nr:chlororespiratory reduction 6 domain-containing protein [uncultured Bacteroides sp.]